MSDIINGRNAGKVSFARKLNEAHKRAETDAMFLGSGFVRYYMTSEGLDVECLNPNKIYMETENIKFYKQTLFEKIKRFFRELFS